MTADAADGVVEVNALLVTLGKVRAAVVEFVNDVEHHCAAEGVTPEIHAANGWRDVGFHSRRLLELVARPDSQA